MRTDYKGRARSYHEAIREVLLKEWDPIGVANIQEAQDEYASYVSCIYKMLVSQKSTHEIFDYLWWAETENMGLKGNRRNTMCVAEKLARLSEG